MSRWENKYIIGLTGNIAVGKSVVRQMLQHLGAYTIDADGLSHQAMQPGAPAYKPVVDAFGQVILNPDKTINRATLGSMVFTNPALLTKLEELTHPIIQQAINTLVTRAKQKVVVIEAIKLLEGSLRDAVDTVWVVNASPKTQYVRLVGKRKMSEEAAKQRIQAQGDQKAKLAAANYVINNDGNVEETWKQVQAGWEQVKKAVIAMSGGAAPAAPQPKPAAPSKPTTPAAAAPKPAAPVDTSGVVVKRGMPSHAETIANFIKRETGEEIGRMDVIMSFGQKSYLLAEAAGKTVGMIGWQVENLITRADELYLDAGSDAERIVYALLQAVEDSSQELQSEVSFMFLPSSTPEARIQPFLNSGYEMTTVKDIKIPAWREAVQEKASDDVLILTKKLRKDRVLKPI